MLLRPPSLLSSSWQALRQAMLRAAWDALRPTTAPRPQQHFDERSVMVLAPHADDEAIGCAGTLLRHLAAGASVSIVYLTDGRRGSAAWHDASLSASAREALETRTVAVRAAEAQEWARRMRQHAGGAEGAEGSRGRLTLHWLGGVDGMLSATAGLVGSLAALLDAERPAWIYLPSPFDAHPDHLAVRALLDAAGRRCTQGHAPTLAHYEIWSPLPASRVVDVGAQMPGKLEALEAYASQLADTPHVAAVAGLNAYRALMLPERRGAAEAFMDTPWRAARSPRGALLPPPRSRVAISTPKEQP